MIILIVVTLVIGAKGFFEDRNQGKCTHLIIKLNEIDPLFIKKYIFEFCNKEEKLLFTKNYLIIIFTIN